MDHSELNGNLADLVPAGICVCDAPSGVIRSFNRYAAELWGRTPERNDRFCGSLRLFRADGTPLPHPDSPAGVTLRTGEPVRNAELAIERPDGSRRFVLASTTPCFDETGSLTAAMSMLLDITDRKASLVSERQRAEEDLRYVMEHARCLLWHATVEAPREGECFFHWDFNFFDEEAAQRFLPLQLDPGESYVEAFYRHKPEEDQARVDRTAKAALRAGLSHYTHEYRCRRLDGELRWLYEEVQLEAVAPEKWRAAGFSMDVTERKRLEAELRLQMEVQEESGRRKDEFLAMLAHELRNPLGATGNALWVLEQAGADEAARQRALAVLKRQIARQSRMVDDLLDVSRITRGLVDIRRECVDLARIVRDTAEDCRPALDRSGLDLMLELPDAPVWVEGDPIRLGQIVGNLLHNAGKFTGAGGRATLRMVPDFPSGTVAVAVQDTGVGIAPDLLARVFDSFVQGDRSLARSTGGLGLGLALVKGLAELHGGTVSAHSDGPGQGATFTLRLPLRVPGVGCRVSSESPLTRHATPDVPTSKRVLVVEDNRDAAETLGDLLEMAGHEVEIALTGLAGVEAARRFRPQVVLCDIGLPGMDGYEVAARLRRESGLPVERLIAITGYGQEEDRSRSRAAGFDHHLTKPVDPRALLDLLSDGCEGPGT